MTDAAPRQVPEYEREEWRPRRARHALCVFVINENGRLHRQLEKMRAYAGDVDVVIADGGSSDGSTARALLEPLGVNSLLTKRGPGKLGAQMRMAFDWALDRGYEGVIVMDGNDKDDPAAIPSMVQALEEDFDHVQGSRFVPGGRAVNTPFSRYWAIKLLHAPLMSLAAGRRCTDTTNGFRAYSRRLLSDPRVQPFRDCFPAYELHYYLQIRAARLGFRTCERPVTRAYPDHGPVPTKISPVRGNLKVLRTLLAAVFGCFDPPRERT